MTPRERYLNTLAGKPTDFIPRLPILMRYAAEYIGSDYGKFAADYRVLTRANQVCAADFGIDQMNTMSDPFRETQGYGAEIIYGESTGAHIICPPLSEQADLSLLKRPDPMNAKRMRDRIEAVRTYCQNDRSTYSVMGWVEGPAAEAADIRGPENFFIDLLTDPEFACGLMDLCTEVAIDFAKPQIALGADTIGIGDAVASQVSPQIYESLILPREKRLVSALKAMGAKVRLHICGNITHLLPGIASLGIDVLDVDHMVNMARVREIVGRQVTLAGNIDPVEGILFGKPKQIREYMQKIYEQVGNPFAVNAGCEIPSGTPKENLLALCEPIPWMS